ncbi:hypothetical protein F7725_028065 [Dissostichus mawsoni]|uniref:Uncharacterized protein n=1 Tax=Dissostichus mawsoni TaxID=36200 RepID=A0A7J5XFX8_DISMA|nr:hypothetical protein F7725_028065 [Dissostichus mawsoni]
MIKGEETVKHLKDLRTRAKVALGRKVNSVTKMVNTMLEEELMKEYGEVHKAGTKVTEANSEYLMKLILNADSDEDQVSEELRADVEKTDGETSQRLEEVSEVIKANLWSRHGERKVMFAVGEAEKVYEEAEATQIDLVSYESYEKQLNNLEILIKELKEVHSTWRGWAPATAKTDVEEIVRQLETRKNALKRQKEAEFNKARGAAELARTAAEDERAQFALVQLRQDQAQRSKLAEAQIAAEEARPEGKFRSIAVVNLVKPERFSSLARLCGVVTWVRRAAEKWLTRRGRAAGQAKWEARVLDKRKGKPVPLRGDLASGSLKIPKQRTKKNLLRHHHQSKVI